MPFSDEQVSLLATAVAALHTWQDTAGQVDVVLQQVTMDFPSDEGESKRSVTFTWQPAEERFTISS
jgi:hypothetical protein